MSDSILSDSILSDSILSDSILSDRLQDYKLTSCTSRITRLGFKPQANRIKSSEED
ncbi:hypothetical protein [Coleofasciculus sp. H7-2]|uniref:hypothetical protein n=1 Tax=Coleofasciculus sp. H7-2 TaxID=3351545 RepID=UPI00366AFA22